VSGLIVGLALLLAGGAELWLCWRGSQRRLTPSSWVGIRLPATRRSDAAWYAAHEAAAGPFGVGGGIAATCGLGVFVNGWDTVGAVVAAVGLVALLGGTAGAVVVGVAAARELPEPTDGPDFGG
jgi:SdpI/YfhL protein family